ncbi:hypothetical protein [Psychrobacter sp. SZ93C1]|uniref:hypothetical protein n=1 Tax=Psychrobacter sp. SZ93C1 TaxID=2792058 RepID=UPI0018CCA14A|nr:hypothetical protein [Psychrobacter sp. SZ93C1]MBH0063613.1 hypothetical protein [Psychrobacter sp. SZ93C1]
MRGIESRAVVIVPSSSYPKGKVIGLYGLLGGAIGGLITFSYIIVLSVIKEGASIQDVPDFIKMLAAGAVFGFFLGLLPALLTGYSAYKLEIYFDSIRNVFPLFAIGFMSTFLCIVWFMLESYSTDSIINIILICCIGGASAIATGLIALPKHK